MSLSILPPEILGEIVSDLHPSQQRTMRLACRALNAASEPFALSTFAVTGHLLQKENAAELLQNIADGRSTWGRYARTLVVQALRNLGQLQETDAESEKEAALRQALAAMPLIHSVQWTVRDGEFQWMHLAVQSALGNLKHLDSLDVHIMHYRTPYIPFDLSFIGGLKNLKFQATTGRDFPPINEQVAKIVAQSPDLRSLDLTYQDYSPVWNRLPGHAQLTKLRTTHVNANLLQFVASQAGLTELWLSVDAGDKRSSNALARTFLPSVLACQAPTLVELSLFASYENDWSVVPSSADVLRSVATEMVKLKELSVSVNSSDAEKAVHRALNLIPLFPALETLSITYSSSEGARRARCGNPRMMHGKRMRDGIAAAMQSFRTSTDFGAAGRMFEAHASGAWLFGAVGDDGEQQLFGFKPKPLTPEQEEMNKRMGRRPIAYLS
ncbi:F-box domain-containing protein [Mycena chlorophos]|uniref:F-box domain-containing protein n=1 Tax=Mycena chlorophos TaxID=658473 RepID=A0A8H6WGZ8_MYCCL|nr:F-box domain-containing protein [Mycena chlorophos]